MNLTLRIFIIIISGFVFFNVIYMLVKRNLSESNSILWFFIASLTLLSGIFPGLLDKAAALVGIDYQPAFLFLVSIIALLLLSFKSSIDISKIESRLAELAITLSILKEENRRLSELADKLGRPDSER